MRPAQFTAMKGRDARADRAWISRAMSSFPTPLSPVMSTLASPSPPPDEREDLGHCGAGADDERLTRLRTLMDNGDESVLTTEPPNEPGHVRYGRGEGPRAMSPLCWSSTANRGARWRAVWCIGAGVSRGSFVPARRGRLDLWPADRLTIRTAPPDICVAPAQDSLTTFVDRTDGFCYGRELTRRPPTGAIAT